MYGFSKETYEAIRVGGIYESVLSNTLKFRELLWSRPQVAMKFEMQFSLLEENQHEVKEFEEFWRAKGAYVKIRPKASWAGKIEAKNLSLNLERVPCQWALSHGAILWTGELVACGVDCEGGFVAGNVGEKTIKEIWDTTHKRFRETHLNEQWKDLPDICKGCLDWQTTPREYLSPLGQEST